ncbi:MAG TPA: AMP-binding protein, partial [Thermoanaerobaculia bacterium]
PEVLELPLDRPRRPDLAQRAQNRPLVVPQPLAERLIGLARTRGATPFMALLAGYFTLLSRLSAQDDLVIGAPVAGRNRLETERLIGFFVNTLALRGEMLPGIDYARLLAQVRETTLGAYAHQDLPFERLVEELSPVRSLSHSPLFQVLLVLQNLSLGELELPGLTLEPAGGERGGAKFDLTLAVSETPQGFLGSFEYSPELLDATTVDRLAASFVALLGSIVEHPELPLAEQPMLTAAERHQLAWEWGSLPPEPERPSFLARIARWIAKTPEGVAAVLHGEELTYRELGRKALLLARRLCAAGVGFDVPVALYCNSSLEAMVGLVGILAAGGAYLALDPKQPDERLLGLLDDAAVRLLVAERALVGALPQGVAARGIAVVPAEIEGEGAGEPETPFAPPPVPSTALAYLIYTSGSTGRPKGVMVPHSGVEHLLAGQAHLALGPGRRVLQFFSLSFDGSVWELLGALAAGATLVLADREERIPGPAFVRLLEETAVDTLTITPSAL